ncbi:MAG: hypothetical protein ACYC9L_02970 [Sulfuricaulis sp.]
MIAMKRRGNPTDAVTGEALGAPPTAALIDTLRLARMLGYPSANALRHAHGRGRLPVPLFTMPGRRGLFARLVDVENLMQQGLQLAQPTAQSGISRSTRDAS